MKKLMLAVVLGLLLIAAFTTLALADNGPHGSFTASTDACASCHRAHSAQYGSNALLIMAPDALCLSCHDGTGAGTNVEDGVYVQTGADSYYPGTGVTVEGVDGASLFGGGFDNALMATTWSGAQTANIAFNAVSAPTTSNHTFDGVSGTVWGSGANNSVNTSYALECVSCHDPHGTAGWNTSTTPDTRVASYRLLRWQPSGSSGFTAPATAANWSGGAFPTNDATTPVSGWLVPDNYATIGTEWYTIGTQTLGTTPVGPFAVGDYNNGNANNTYQPLGQGGVTQTYVPAAVNTAMFCAQCHDRYFNNSRLRNATDASAYCGEPGSLYAALPDFAPVGGVHPVDPVRCTGPYTSTQAPYNLGPYWGDGGASGDTTYMFRHASGDIRASADGAVAAGAGTSVSRSCVACHVSHGTTAQMTAFASDATLAAVAGADLDNSTLLRMDNRSLCLRCHASTVNFTVAP